MFPVLEDLFTVPSSPAISPWFIASVVLAAPIVEEIVISRISLHAAAARPAGPLCADPYGIPLRRRALRRRLALSAPSSLPVSLVLGYARERLGSTLPCMILHMIYNAGAVAAELLRI